MGRSDEIVVRGSKAMTIVFQMSSRVSSFIDQSHLETTKGKTGSSCSVLVTDTLQLGPLIGRPS
jgi:brefeldin A-resistance guanine nucleotide exchange factor 1